MSYSRGGESDVSDKNLLAAIERGDVAAAKKALDAGAKPDAPAPNGEKPLVLAAAAGGEEIVALLLDRGAPVDGASEAGNTALMHAAACGHHQIVRLLLRRGAGIAHKNRWGMGAQDWSKWPANGAEIAAEMQAKPR